MPIAPEWQPQLLGCVPVQCCLMTHPGNTQAVVGAKFTVVVCLVSFACRVCLRSWFYVMSGNVLLGLTSGQWHLTLNVIFINGFFVLHCSHIWGFLRSAA